MELFISMVLAVSIIGLVFGEENLFEYLCLFGLFVGKGASFHLIEVPFVVYTSWGCLGGG